MINKGFTLIETVIYIALFSIIMTGLFVTAFQIYQSTGKTFERVVAQEEMSFVLKKIDWALADPETINSPTSGTSTTLSVDKTDFSDNPVIIRYNSTDKSVEFCKDSPCNASDFVPLTTVNVEVNNLSFKYLDPVGTGPAGVETTLSIDGVVNVSTKYLKI